MNFGLFFRSVGPSVPSILHVSFGRISLFSVGCQTCLLSPKSPFLSPRFSVQMFCRPNLLSPNRRVDCAVAKPTFQIAVFRALFAVSGSADLLGLIVASTPALPVSGSFAFSLFHGLMCMFSPKRLMELSTRVILLIFLLKLWAFQSFIFWLL